MISWVRIFLFCGIKSKSPSLRWSPISSKSPNPEVIKRTGSVPFPSRSALVQRVVANRISAFTDFQSRPLRARISRIPKTGASHPDSISTATGKSTLTGSGSSRVRTCDLKSHPLIRVEKPLSPPTLRVKPMGKSCGQLSIFEIFSLRSLVSLTASADRDPRDKTLARNHLQSGERPRQSVKVPPVSTKKNQASFSPTEFIGKRKQADRLTKLQGWRHRYPVNSHPGLP